MGSEFKSLKTAHQSTIALLDWGHLIEDFLDHLGVSFEKFRSEFRRSWIFSYIDAFKMVGIQTVLFCISARVQKPWRFTNVPTGTPMVQSPGVASAMARKMRSFYAF
jgi:starch synthase